MSPSRCVNDQWLADCLPVTKFCVQDHNGQMTLVFNSGTRPSITSESWLKCGHGYWEGLRNLYVETLRVFFSCSTLSVSKLEKEVQSQIPPDIKKVYFNKGL